MPRMRYEPTPQSDIIRFVLIVFNTFHICHDVYVNHVNIAFSDMSTYLPHTLYSIQQNVCGRYQTS